MDLDSLTFTHFFFILKQNTVSWINSIVTCHWEWIHRSYQNNGLLPQTFSYWVGIITFTSSVHWCDSYSQLHCLFPLTLKGLSDHILAVGHGFSIISNSTCPYYMLAYTVHIVLREFRFQRTIALPIVAKDASAAGEERAPGIRYAYCGCQVLDPGVWGVKGLLMWHWPLVLHATPCLLWWEEAVVLLGLSIQGSTIASCSSFILRRMPSCNITFNTAIFL
jgi:hypothetical protein